LHDSRTVAHADRALLEIVRPSGLRKCTSHADEPATSKELTSEQSANVAAKELFAKRCLEALGEEMSVRDLALFFGVKKSTLHERMSRRRTDLAPLPAWFQKLRDYAEFQRLSALFLRQA